MLTHSDTFRTDLRPEMTPRESKIWDARLHGVARVTRKSRFCLFVVSELSRSCLLWGRIIFHPMGKTFADQGHQVAPGPFSPAEPKPSRALG